MLELAHEYGGYLLNFMNKKENNKKKFFDQVTSRGEVITSRVFWTFIRYLT
jgi:hypothetical protein